MPHPPICIAFRYLELYKQNPEMARASVAQVIKNNPSLSVSALSKICCCTRNVIYDILDRIEKDIGFANRSCAPKSSPNKIDSALEDKIVTMRKTTNFGCIRIMCELKSINGTSIHHNTVGKVLKRKGLNSRKRRKSKNQELRDCYYSPFHLIEIDIKEIQDSHALPQVVYDHVDRYNLPNYQFTAIDTFTRLRWLSYGYEKSFTNGLSFLFYILLELRQAGVKETIVFQTDNGQEFGGFEEKKINRIDEELKLFNCRFIHIPKGQKYKQGHVERSHKTDDEELYIPFLTEAKNTKEFIELTSKWVWYYNTERSHQGSHMKLKSPFKYAKDLQESGWESNDREETEEDAITGLGEKKIKYLPKTVKLEKLQLIPVLLLDNVCVELMFYYQKLLNQLKKIESSELDTKLKYRTESEIKSVVHVCVQYRKYLTNIVFLFRVLASLFGL